MTKLIERLTYEQLDYFAELKGRLGSVPVASRLEEAADEILHTLIRVAVKLDRASPDSEQSPVDFATSVIDVYHELDGDIEDEDAFEAVLLAKLAGHDPETRA